MAVALVTGASRGIGAATVRTLARDGWDVCISYRVSRGAAESVVEQCRSAGRQAIAVQADVTSETDILALFAAVDEMDGELAVLVNNAGIVGPQQRLEDMTVGRWRGMFDVNVIGPMLCCRQAIPRMSTRHGHSGGSVVNISSIVARIGSPEEYVDYAASKGAVDTLTIGLGKELAADGIRVNAVRPGIIDTEIHASGGQPDRVDRLRSGIPLQRAGTAGEIAEAVAWLCSQRASYTTGALLDVGGGR